MPQRTSLFSGLSCVDNIKGIAQLIIKDKKFKDKKIIDLRIFNNIVLSDE